MIILHILLYVLSLSALTLLAWLNPRRLRIAQLTQCLPVITGGLRLGLMTMVSLPLIYAIWRGNWAELCIAAGVLLVAGWCLALWFAVAREEQMPRDFG